MESKFYAELDNGTVRLLKNDSSISEPVVKHSFDLRGTQLFQEFV